MVEEEYTTDFDEIHKGLKKPSGYAYRRVFEILSSPWINELKVQSEQVGRKDSIKFLDKAHHYCFPLGNNVLEVLAFEQFSLTLEK